MWGGGWGVEQGSHSDVQRGEPGEGGPGSGGPRLVWRIGDARAEAAEPREYGVWEGGGEGDGVEVLSYSHPVPDSALLPIGKK